MARDKNPPEVKYGLAERAIELFSPRAARMRYSERVAVANMRRAYEGASKGRTMDGWRAANTSADAEVHAAGSVLRSRMRDLVRNNPLAAQAVQVLVNNIVGPGIRPRAKTGDPERDKKINALFSEWSKTCDAHGHTDFYGLSALAVREMIEGGDLFALRRPRRMSRSRRVPLEIELREADHLDDSRVDYRPSGGRIALGIEYDEAGRRTGYWMFPDHPGDTLPGRWHRYESVRVPARNVAHLFERQRVQSRGVPWGAPAMAALRDLGDWQVAEMVRKKTEACLVGVLFGADSDESRSVAPILRDANGDTVEGFEPGMFAYAENGKDIKFNTPASSGGVREWNLVQMHIISAGWRVPYALMTNDLSQANFSSNRAGLNEFRRMVDQLQWTCVIPMFCQKVWDWFIEAAFLAGEIDTPTVPVEWAPPKFESVNPWQDAQTDLLETRAGFVPLRQQIAKRGYDHIDVFEEFSGDVKELDARELIFDSDPRRVTKAGGAQNAPGDENEPPPPTGGNQRD